MRFKKCRFCKAEIPAIARVCRFCCCSLVTNPLPWILDACFLVGVIVACLLIYA